MAKLIRGTWVNPSPMTNVAYQQIWRSISGGPFFSIGAQIPNGSPSSFVDENGGPGFGPGLTLIYEVRAYAADGVTYATDSEQIITT
jgi:hypothetical protein